MKREWEKLAVESAEENSGREMLTRVAGLDGPNISSHQNTSTGRGRRGVGEGRWRTVMTHSSRETNDPLIREQSTCKKSRRDCFTSTCSTTRNAVKIPWIKS